MAKAEVFYIRNKKYNCYKNGVPYFCKTATIDGKRRFFYGDGERDALKQIEEAKKQSFAGLIYDKKNAKVGKIFRYWLFEVKRVDKDIKASSFSRYESTFRVHIEPYPIAESILSKVDSMALQSYVTSLYEDDGMSAGSIAATVKVLRMFFAWALDEGYITKNPCKNIVIPGKRDKGKKRIEVFTEEERKRLVTYMAESKYQYDTIILLAFATGMRQGELLALRWEDIYNRCINVSRSTAVFVHVDKNGEHERKREVWDTKTENSVRSIPLLPSTEKLLSEHWEKQKKFFKENGIEDRGYVFTTVTGELIDPSSMRKSYERLLKRAGIPYRKFHTIRHTFATEAIRRGVNVKDLQILMGHSDIETTYIYVQADELSQRSAIERMGDIV